MCYLQSDFQDSVRWFDKAEAWAREHGRDLKEEIFVEYGDALWHLGRKEEALAAWRQALADAKAMPGGEEWVKEPQARLDAVDRHAEPPLTPTIKSPLRSK